MLIREMMSDPLLSKYSVIMLDEAHERTLFLDVVVGLLYKVQRKRPDLRLIISSATLDAEEFKSFFNRNATNDSALDTAAILTVEGRTYPVEVQYAEKPVADYVEATVTTALDIHAELSDGDILAFVTGQEEVSAVCERLRARSETYGARGDAPSQPKRLLVLPMYGGLPAAEQLAVFEPAPEGVRKVIVATNIAEASVTIDGVAYVIDCGFVKMKGYSPDTGLESLVITPVSQASANQRAGRAGRLQPGVVFRLYTEQAFEKLSKTNIPEMQRSNLAGVLLQMKALGIGNVLRFPFLSPPPARSMARGLELLVALGGLDDCGDLTAEIGIAMAEMPLEPMQSRSLLASGALGCSLEVATVLAMLQVQHVFLEPHNRKHAAQKARLRFSCTEGDHLTLLNVYLAFLRHGKSARWCSQHFLNYKSLCRAVEIRGQLLRYLKRFKVPLVSCDGDSDSVLRCIVAGYFSNAARLGLDGKYRTVRDGQQVQVHPSSVLYVEQHPPYVVFNEIMLTSDKYMRDISGVDPEWLSELAPHFYSYKSEVRTAYDDQIESTGALPAAKKLRTYGERNVY